MTGTQLSILSFPFLSFSPFPFQLFRVCISSIYMFLHLFIIHQIKLTTIMTSNAKPEWDRLLSAAQKNNADLIHSLITIDKVSPSHANAVGQSALHIACLWGNISAVEALLSHGAATKAQNRITGASPLHSCIQSSKEPLLNRVTCAQLLIDQGGADVHLTDLYGSTAMDSLQEEIERHGQSGQSLPQDYIAQMMQVLESGDKRVLYLIPLVLEQNLEGLQALLDNNHIGKDDAREQNIGDDMDIDMDERDPKTGQTALLLAIEQITNHSLNETLQEKSSVSTKEQMEDLSNIVQLLLQKGSDPNTIPNKNLDDTILPDTMSPFYMICKALDAENIKRLNDDDDSNAIHEESSISSLFSFKEACLNRIAIDLLAHGAKLSTEIIQMMHDAARRDNTRTIKFWVEALGVDPNMRGRQGLTPLHFAARSGKVRVVDMLLSFEGIDLSVVDDRNKTAMDAAQANGRQEVVDLLMGHSAL